MAQSSLMDWLSKPSSLQEPQQAKLPRARIGVNEDSPALLTPPPSSPVDLNFRRSSLTGTVEGTRPSTGHSKRSSLSGITNASRPSTGHSKTSSLGSITNGARPTISDSRRTIPPNVELRASQKEDISHLKRLNSLLLPIPYPDKFYRDIIEDDVTNNITLVAVWHDDMATVGKEKGRLVGAIRCRLLAHAPVTEQKVEGPMLYLSTLVLLSPYRNYGIASKMLDVMVKRAVNDYNTTSVGAHVWEANAEGLEWYRKRGFSEVAKEEGYYRRLNPQGAVVMQRRVRVRDLIDD